MKIVLNYAQVVWLYMVTVFLYFWNLMQNVKKTAMSFIALALMFAGASAHAALDPAVATTFTTVQSDFTSMIGLVWPVIGAVFAALGIIGLVRAALNRGGIRA